MTRLRLAALAVGAASLVWVLSTVGWAAVLDDVGRAGLALPAAIGVHAVQLAFSAWAWRAAMGERRLGLGFLLRVRWVREGLNTMLPTAQIGGQVVGARLLARAGVAPTVAVAGLILDLMLEAAAQVLVILAAVLLLLAWSDERAWVGWVQGGMGATALGVLAAVAAQRLGAVRWMEAALRKAASRWPAASDWSMAGLHATLMRRQSDRRAMLAALGLNVASWALGAFEVWVLLRALGHEVGLGPAFVIESLAMAARSAGFAVPGAVGVQEGGFVLACGLFGIGADAALALSVLKRLRELVVGAGALLAWQWSGARRPALQR